MKVDAINELSTLTTIDEDALRSLLDKVEWCIADAVNAADDGDDNTAEIDVGFGVITVSIGTNEVRYKFKPSSTLERYILDALTTGSNMLQKEVEKSLVLKLNKIYKDLF